MTQVPKPNYGMFSDLGNMYVHDIVVDAMKRKLYWLQIYQALVDLAASDPGMFGEATDTVVREMVYEKYEEMCIARDNAKETA